MSMELSISEDNTGHGVTRQSCSDPARSETLRMSGSDLHGSWEISSVPTPRGVGGTGKAQSHNPVVHADEKSDTPIVPKKPPNNGGDPAEVVEGRGVAKGNVNKNPASRTQSRNSCASMGLEGVRVVARREKAVRFTALLHHITPQLLVESFYALRHDAAAGVDGVTWRDYEEGLYERVHGLHREIHTVRTEPNHHGGYSYPKQMADSARLASPLWRIKSCNRRWSPY